jgi:anti-anti-sigma factor
VVDARIEGYDGLDALADAVGPLLRRLFPDPEPVALAVHEAAVNGVEHGGTPVAVSLLLVGAELEVRVTDRGTGFDPGAVPDPTGPAGLLRPGGRGLLLIRRVARTVHVRSAGDRTTVVFRIPLPRGEPVNIVDETRGDVSVQHLSGKITIGVGDAALRDAVRRELDEGRKKIVLDLAGVVTIDSSGIGELVSAYTTTAQQGTKLRLAAVPPKVLDILHITQLITVFDVHDTVDEAVSAF